MSRMRKYLFLLLFLSSVTLLLETPAFIRIPSAFLQIFLLPGTVLLHLLWDRKRPFLDDIMIPPMLSPIALAFLVYILYQVTGSLQTALIASLLTFYALLAAIFIFSAKGPENSNGQYQTGSREIMIISFAFASVIFVPYLFNHFLLERSDAWMHASIVNEIIFRGLPPLEPLLPDVSIRYMWFYHLFQASWTVLSRLQVFTAMGVSNIVFAFIFPYLVFRVTSLFTSRKRDLVFTPLFSAAGLQAPSWILFPVSMVRALTGEVRGMAEISRWLGNMELNGHQVMFFLKPDYTYHVSMLDKFYTTTTFNYATDLFLLVFFLACAWKMLERPQVRRVVLIFILLFGTFIFHVVTGVVLIMTLCGASLYIYLKDRIAGEGKRKFLNSLIVPALAIGAGIAGAPYFLSLTGGSSGDSGSISDYFHIGIVPLLTIICPVIILFPFMKRSLKELFSRGETDWMILAGSIVTLALTSIFIDLPGEVEGKFVFILFLLLILPVSWQIIDSIHNASGKKRAILVAVILFLFSVPFAMTVRGFVLDRPKGIETKRFYITDGQRELFQWIKDSTDINSVFIENNIYGLMPVLGERHQFALPENFLLIQGYGGEKILRYGRIRDRLFSERTLLPDDIEAMRMTGRDIYLVIWQEDISENPGLIESIRSQPERYTELFTNAAGTVFHIEIQ
ncbi:MAG: hypothetical protein JW814_02180 [Candidatus Krumholzibacteriota bacterium]|nr:hypothetical protein [Candidatus Krumholzibacteriota bacterium]